MAVAGVLMLCTGCSGDDESGRTPDRVTVTASSPRPTASHLPSASPTPTVTAIPEFAGPGPNGVEITVPPKGVAATGPAVVLLHGGFWVGGSPHLMDDWADTLAATGAVVFNASYRLVGAGGGYPTTLDDVSCAVRYARSLASTLTTSDQLVIMGHSAGGHLAAVEALNGEAFGADCPYPEAPLPDQLVGLAGVYDVREYGSLFGVFVGAPASEVPDEWRAVNPAQLADQRPELVATLVVGADDQLVSPSQADNFAALLPADQVTVTVVPGAAHEDLLDPDVVGLAALHLGG